MSFPVESFWKLVVDAQLLTLEDCHRHHAGWLQQNPQGGDAQSLAEFLVATNVISRYQASILLAGRAGPFVYGDYRIYDRIESGRLSGIFRALHIQTMHRVCLQFLTAEQAASPEAVAYLTQRSTLTSQVSAGCPNLLRCYHLVDLGPFKFFVLEDLQGKRVERLLQQQGAMKPSEACRIIRQAALGLARMHSMQQAHGDVRPSNIWVDAAVAGAKGTVKMLQFPMVRDPLAPPIEWRKQLALGDGKIPPEADFVAPELIGGGVADARSDIYQLGCSFYQMLTNKPPFAGETLRAKLEGHLKEQPTPIHKLNPNVPTDLSKLIGYMLQKKPEMRFQQVSVVVEKLVPFMSTAESQMQPPPPSRNATAYDAWIAETLNAAAAAAAANPGYGHGTQQAPQQQQPMQQHPMQQPMQQAPMGGQYGAAPNPYNQQPAQFGQQPAPYGQQPASPFGQQQPAAFGQQPAPFGQQPASPQPFAAPQPFSAPQPFAPPMGSAPAGPAVGTSETYQPKKGSSFGLIAILIAVPLLGAAGYFGWDRFMKKRPGLPPERVALRPNATGTAVKKPVPTGTAPTPTATAAAPKGVAVPKRDLIASTGADPMYDSPTAGKPLSLSHMVPGVQMVIAVRPAEIVKHAESANLLDPKVSGSLGPWLATTLPTITGVPNETVEQVIVGILDGPSSDAVRYAYVVRYNTVVAEADLLKAWGGPTEEMSDTTKIYVKDGTAYYLPTSEQGKVAVVVPKEEIAGVLKYKGSPPQLRLELEYLVQSATDTDRHLTMLYTPYFLESGGKSLVAGPVQTGLPAINWLLTGVGLPQLASAGDGSTADGGGLADGGAMSGSMNSEDALPPKAIAFSAHLGDAFFYELRTYNGAATAFTEALAEPLFNRVKEIPKRVEAYVLSSRLSPYSRAVLFKFPGMVKFVDSHVRAGCADRQIVLRGYMPAIAAHNILLGAYLCLLESPSAVAAPTAVAKGPASPAATAGLTGAQAAIKKPMSLTFDRNNLEVTMQLIAEEIGVPIEIIGTDLQLEGITKNQSFGLDEKVQPADQILRTIMKKANPDGKLVYVIKPKKPGDPDMIFITTRAAVEKRKDKLPAELVAAPPAKK
ncbi:MAG: protein kinase [Planctomycetia bacterium]|nr:protein kinase [Planctomycetia bacterium]